MRLKEYAKLQGITYQTAWNWFKSGLILNAYQMPTGTIIVPIDNDITNKEKIINVIYCRVSNQSRKKELEYQVKRVEDYCIANGMTISRVYKEVASGMNDNRLQLWKMINSKPTTIIVENKDRLTRFGFRYIKNLLEKLDTKIIVIHEDATDEQDLIKDLVSIITSFCCRLYGMRRGYKKAQEIKNTAIS
jgi:predicted site-specific integrase-resolvase